MITEDILERLIIARIQRDIYKSYTTRLVTLSEILSPMYVSSMRDCKIKNVSKLSREIFKTLEKYDTTYSEVFSSLEFVLQAIITDFVNDNTHMFSDEEKDKINELFGVDEENEETKTIMKHVPGYG